GLKAAHEKGILHRDVKPDNVLVRRHGPGWRVKLIDFGLALRQSVIHATLATSAAKTATLRASITGTLDYAAPEQLGRLPGVPVGPRPDVYGSGRTCCFALFGTAQPLRKHWKSLPEPLADLLEGCLAERPEERPDGFDTILSRLEPPAERRPEPVPEPTPKPSLRKFWTAPPAGEVRRCEGHTEAVTCLAVSAVTRNILSGSEDKTLRLWDTTNGRELICMPGHKSAVCSVAVTPNGSAALSSGTDQTVRLWDLATGKEVRRFDGMTNRAMAISEASRLA